MRLLTYSRKELIACTMLSGDPQSLLISGMPAAADVFPFDLVPLLLPIIASERREEWEEKESLSLQEQMDGDLMLLTSFLSIIYPFLTESYLLNDAHYSSSPSSPSISLSLST